ncbi:MAG TPA: hypothetical protein DCM87_10820 [Planctomycetes bacterium]|nr:hypothetical protein [Planctomycetota bacterium]
MTSAPPGNGAGALKATRTSPGLPPGAHVKVPEGGGSKRRASGAGGPGARSNTSTAPHPAPSRTK